MKWLVTLAKKRLNHWKKRPGFLCSRLRMITHRLGVSVSAVAVNALTPPGCARCRRTAAAEAQVVAALGGDVASQASRGCAIIQAPAVAPPPRGVAALAAWRRAWVTAKR